MSTIVHREIRHFHLFCGLGGGARGFNKATPRLGKTVGKMRCIGGIDVDPAAVRDFERLSGARGSSIDLFSREQYVAFHGKEPPADWQEAGIADIHRAAGHERPHIVFLSAPCKGFSGLLSETKSRLDKYQALNSLTLRGIWLMLEAWKDDPVELVVFENVPRIANRGRKLLDQIGDLLRAYGYAVAETTHDCGELGGLAQSRKRFLLVARHMEKVKPFLYEPVKKSLKSVGQILDMMPLPGDPLAGPMHRVPRLQWKTWLRLAFVEAGSDWRSLNKLVVENGHLRDYLIVPEMRGGTLGVLPWESSAGTIIGTSHCSNGAYSVADPRFAAGGDYGQMGVRKWEESTGTITGQRSPIQGGFSVADPRMPDSKLRQNGIYRVVEWDGQAGAITGAAHVAGAAMSVADPRRDGPSYGKYPVTAWDEASGTVISGSTTGQGAFAVADPRTGISRGRGDNYLTARHYGITRWDEHCGVISAAASYDNGKWSVADPRDIMGAGLMEDMPKPTDKLIAVIRALDVKFQ